LCETILERRCQQAMKIVGVHTTANTGGRIVALRRLRWKCSGKDGRYGRLMSTSRRDVGNVARHFSAVVCTQVSLACISQRIRTTRGASLRPESIRLVGILSQRLAELPPEAFCVMGDGEAPPQAARSALDAEHGG